MPIEVIEADLTTLAVDAIVTAANETLLGGGGVDGAIHRAAGPGLLRACRALPELRPGVRCPTGEARLTPGFALPARHVIHTVGPVWRGGAHGEAERLVSCYRDSLRLAAMHDLHSIAFPAISCGVYGYPVDAAVAIALREMRAWLAAGRAPGRIVCCCFGASMANAYRRALVS
ncbi:MAG: O-acetyl-ADP-ribose deacetylase [Xanthomonadales bacterium]|nr:O-acetyl-ADP-ribose deacetylase [Xanthomonadales bacterium]